MGRPRGDKAGGRRRLAHLRPRQADAGRRLLPAGGRQRHLQGLGLVRREDVQRCSCRRRTSSTADTACARARCRSSPPPSATCASARATATTRSRSPSSPPTAGRRTPFPPALKTVEAPMAVGPKPASERPTAEAAAPSRSLFGPFEIALGLVIVALGGLVLRRNRSSRPPPQTGGATAAAGAAAERFFPIVLLAVRRQRLRRADVRDHLVPGPAAGARVVRGVDRGAARHVHGRHVHRQPRPCPLHAPQPAPLARVRDARDRDRGVRPADAGRDPVGPEHLHRDRRPRLPGPGCCAACSRRSACCRRR